MPQSPCHVRGYLLQTNGHSAVHSCNAKHTKEIHINTLCPVSLWLCLHCARNTLYSRRIQFKIMHCIWLSPGSPIWKSSWVFSWLSRPHYRPVILLDVLPFGVTWHFLMITLCCESLAETSQKWCCAPLLAPSWVAQEADSALCKWWSLWSLDCGGVCQASPLESYSFSFVICKHFVGRYFKAVNVIFLVKFTFL